jgi:hypothetical protein
LLALLEFVLHLSAPSEKLIELATDYAGLSRYLPNQLKSIRIIEKNNNETITQEELVFSTIIKNKIIQQTKHSKLSKTELKSEIILGPATGSTILVTFSKLNEGTNVSISANLKLSLKAKFLSPIIKKLYKTVMTGILYKMNADALQQKSGL